MITCRVSVTRKGDAQKHIEKVVKSVQGPKSVKVGLPKGKAAANVIDYAFFNHEGTAGSQANFVRNGVGGFGGPIPRRPFILVAMFLGRGSIRGAMRKIAINVVQAKTQLRPEMEKLGLLGQNLIKTTIGKLGPANSDLTKQIKGSSTPLIDSGRMRSSVTHEVE